MLPVMMRSTYRSPVAMLAAGTLLLLASPKAGHALMVYSATGSSISGSLGGMTFSDAEWSLTATADEKLAKNTSFRMGPGTFNLWWLPVTPRLKIETMATVLEADLLPSDSFRWLALSGTFPVGPTPKIGFVFTTPMFLPETAAGVIQAPGSFIDLKSPYSVTGTSIFETNTFPTSAGALVIGSSSFIPGTFRIDPVPTPLPALAVAGAFSWSRRLRARIKRLPG